MGICRVGVLLPLVCGAGCALAVAGCGASVVRTGEVDLVDVNLATIGRVYAQAEQTLGRPPLAADELKPFLPAGMVLDTLLVSPTDNQRYTIVWGTKVLSTPDPKMIIAYERNGANGMRHVLTPAGTRMLSAEAFAASQFPPGHKPDLP
jgi:hypothetical protein